MKRTPMKPRTAGLAKTSKSHCRAKRVQRRAYQAAADAEQVTCSACFYCRPLQHSHILTQGNYPKHRNNPLNWLMLCQDCHAMWENNKRMFAHRYPEAYAEKLRRMEALEPQAYQLFILKNPLPAGSTPY